MQLPLRQALAIENATSRQSKQLITPDLEKTLIANVCMHGHTLACVLRWCLRMNMNHEADSMERSKTTCFPQVPGR